eukprot:s6109_g3.t1
MSRCSSEDSTGSTVPMYTLEVSHLRRFARGLNWEAPRLRDQDDSRQWRPWMVCLARCHKARSFLLDPLWFIKRDILASGNSAARCMHLSCLAGCYLLISIMHAESLCVFEAVANLGCSIFQTVWLLMVIVFSESCCS